MPNTTALNVMPLVNPKATTDCPAILPKLNWGYFLTLPKRAFSNQHFFVDSTMLVSARTVRLQPIATSLLPYKSTNRAGYPKSDALNRWIITLANNVWVHLYDYKTDFGTGYGPSLLPCKHGLIFSDSPANEMHFSTRQFVLSTRQCFCPPVRPVRVDNWLLGPYSLTNTDWYFLSLPNEMHFSTRQFTLSTRKCFCPPVRPVRVDNRFLEPSALQTRTDIF